MLKKMLRKLWMSNLACILAHSKKYLKKEFYAIDPTTKRPYHKYKCKICGRKYMANNKFDWYRLKLKTKKKWKVN